MGSIFNYLKLLIISGKGIHHDGSVSYYNFFQHLVEIVKEAMPSHNRDGKR